MIDGLKTMYNDFYGPADDRDKKGGKIDDPKSAAGDAGAPVKDIQVEVTTQEVSAVKPKLKATAAAEDPGKPKEPEKTGMEELNELIGLESVKHDVEELIGLAKVKKMREEKGMKTVPVSLHLVFSGNPGTGKTTVARILAKLYKEIGILSTGQLIETDRSGLVAGYVGQTAIKTQAKIEEAMGGVLFIDEAYTLAVDNSNSYNDEAIATLIQAMENYRDKLVVIFAGYTKEMQAFLDSNSGIVSRIGYTLEFDDYTTDELIKIFKNMATKSGFIVEESAIEYLKTIIDENRNVKNFGNARFVRNIYEKTIIKHASRVKSNKQKKILITITKDDISIDNLIMK